VGSIDSQSASKLDFIQLCSIAECFSEALQQWAWDFHQIGLLFNTVAKMP